MAQSDLPQEVAGQPLTFPQLVDTLDLIAGESVIVRLRAAAYGPEVQQIASIVGVIRRPGRFADNSVYEFSVGEPYPDTHPSHLAGGILFLNVQVFFGRHAENLRQERLLPDFDQNDYV